MKEISPLAAAELFKAPPQEVTATLAANLTAEVIACANSTKPTTVRRIAELLRHKQYPRQTRLVRRSIIFHFSNWYNDIHGIYIYIYIYIYILEIIDKREMPDSLITMMQR